MREKIEFNGMEKVYDYIPLSFSSNSPILSFEPSCFNYWIKEVNFYNSITFASISHYKDYVIKVLQETVSKKTSINRLERRIFVLLEDELKSILLLRK